MAEYNPSKIIKDGNTYNFRDTTKIPLAGSNQISGSLIPATDNSIDVGSSTKNIKMLYTKGITINGVQFSPSDYIPRSGGSVVTGTGIGRVDNKRGLDICGGTSFENGGFVALRGKNANVLGQEGAVVIGTNNGSNNCDMLLKPDGTATWGSKNIAMQEDVIPRSGGAVLGEEFCRTVNDSALKFRGGNTYANGAGLILYGKDNATVPGYVELIPRTSTVNKDMQLRPDGTWTWDGTACQITSDQRLKQQIAEIDDKLLDAWEDVELSQFKYNDAVEQKGKDKARLHTGYVVQQIDKACQEHGVDISEYGLYCHEEYAEETREVEQADGTKTVEVVRPASEHYSLRYTEALIVECAFLRKKNKELQEQLDKLSARLDKLESASSK